MPKTYRHLLVGLLLTGVILLLPRISVGKAGAQSSAAGFTVSPAYFTAQVGSKQSKTSIAVSVRNDFDVPINIELSLNGLDIRNNALIPSTQTESGFEGVVTFDSSTTSIPAHSSKNINIDIHDTPSLAPGGHFISLLLKQVGDNASVGASQLSLKSAVSVAVYIIKEDGAVRSLNATDFKLRHSLFSFPNRVDTTFLNEGNVVVVPRGIVRIAPAGSSDSTVQAVLNAGSIPIYPKSTVTVRTRIFPGQSTYLPTNFNAVLTYRVDGVGRTKIVRASFLYVPVIFLMVLGFTGLLISAFLWRPFRRRFTHLLSHSKSRIKPIFHPPDETKIAASKLTRESARRRIKVQ